jgi:hypothetical protein
VSIKEDFNFHKQWEKALIQIQNRNMSMKENGKITFHMDKDMKKQGMARIQETFILEKGKDREFSQADK